MFDQVALTQYNPETPVPHAPVPPVPPAAASAGLPPAPPEGFVDQFLAFIYTTAHWIGELIMGVLEDILPLQSSDKLVDPVGYLALLTLFLIVAEIAKKIVWLVVLVGWILIGVRIIMEALPMPT